MSHNPSVSEAEHKKTAPAATRCFVLTISDTRTEATDTGGRAIVDLLRDAGHAISGREIVRDDPGAVRAAIQAQLARSDVEVIIATGGTGVSTRDRTFETIDALLDKRLDGFGELFRVLSYEQIGAAAFLSRASAGTSCGKAIFSLPGSEAAVRLGMTKLILPELGHVVRELRR
jgi:molybdenum cofactor biosynthesis protein B